MLFASAGLLRIVGVVRPVAADMMVLATTIVLPIAIVEVWEWLARVRRLAEVRS